MRKYFLLRPLRRLFRIIPEQKEKEMFVTPLYSPYPDKTEEGFEPLLSD